MLRQTPFMYNTDVAVFYYCVLSIYSLFRNQNVATDRMTVCYTE